MRQQDKPKGSAYPVKTCLLTSTLYIDPVECHVNVVLVPYSILPSGGTRTGLYF